MYKPGPSAIAVVRPRAGLTALVVLVLLLAGVPGHAAAADPPLDTWRIDATTVFESWQYEDGALRRQSRERVDMTGSSDGSGDLTWEVRYDGNSPGLCGEGQPGTPGYTEVGSAAGRAGQWEPGGLGYDPADFGLPAGQDWTRVHAEYGSSYQVVTTWMPCEGENYQTQASNGPIPTPIFLPGTVEDLDARPVGDVIERTYQWDRGNAALGSRHSIHYVATKVDEIELPIRVRAAYAFVGVAGLADGGDFVELRGPGVARASRACFLSQWTGKVKQARSDASLLWNGNAAAFLDQGPPDGDEVLDGSIDRQKLKNGTSITESLVLTYCTPFSATSYGARAAYPRAIQLQAVAAVPVSIAHGLRVRVLGPNDRLLAEVGVAGSASKGAKLQVSWLKETEVVVD